MASTAKTDRSSLVRRAVWLLVPLSILIGDLEFRWIREWSNALVAFPGWFWSSVVVSFAAWGAFVLLISARPTRWVFAPLAAVVAGLGVGITWGSMNVRFFAVSPGEVVYLFEEPANAMSMVAAALSWKAWAGWGALVAVWTAVLLLATTSPVARTWRIAASAVLAACALYVACLPTMEKMPWTPYPSDVRSVYVLSRGILDFAAGKNSYSLGFETRDEVPAQTPRSGPSILLIVGESMRPTHMSALADYPRQTTPQLENLIARHPEEVFVFTKHVPSSAATFWALSSIFTGAYPLDSRQELRTRPAIWQYADSVGYHTFVASAQSWEWAQLREVWLDPGPDDFADATTMGLQVTNDTGGDDLPAAQWIAQRIAEGTIEKPFFGVFQMNATHWPFVPKRDVPWDLESDTDYFDAATARSDEAIGVLIDALEHEGLLEDTIVILTSDHAELLADDFPAALRQEVERQEPALLQGARVGSCEPVFASSLLVMFIPERWQDQAGLNPSVLRQNTERVTSHTDIFVAVLRLLGLSPSATVDGVDPFAPIPPDRIALCLSAPGWVESPMTGVGARQDDMYLYARANLSRPYAYDLSVPTSLSRRHLPTDFPPEAQAMIERLRDNQRLRGVLQRALPSDGDD